MKKGLALILSALLMICPLNFVADAEFSEDNIEIEIVKNYIDVTVTAEMSGTMTAQLIDDGLQNFYGIGFDNSPIETDGNYTYTFSFKLPSTARSGTYRVRVGNNVSLTTKTFNFMSPIDKGKYYDGLEMASDIRSYLETNSSLSPVDLTEYLALTDVLPLVNSAIDSLDLATGIDYENDSYDEIETKATEKEILFKEKFESVMKAAVIVDTESENWSALLDELFDSGEFDSKYYDETTAGAALLARDDVYENFKDEVSKMTELDFSECVSAFDRATLITLEQKKDYGTLKTAFLYYEDKGAISPNMSNINALVNAGKDTELWKQLRDKENADCDDLVSNAESIAQTLVDSGILNTPAGGNSIGGGGGGGSRPATPTTDEPKNPSPTVSVGETNDEEGTNIEAPVFSDISHVEWAKDAIDYLAKEGVISGRGNGEFAPDDFVTREEFVKMIVCAFDLTHEGAVCDFSDVSEESWSYSYIASAYRLGIVSGSGEEFNPSERVQRQDMATILYRVCEMTGIENSASSVSFKDQNAISDYAKEAVEKLSGLGIINGMDDGNFMPKESMTRAQAAKVIYGLLTLLGGVE